jgi:hypothetical protein
LDSGSQAETNNEYISEPTIIQALNKPQNTPDWWQPLEYYETVYGDSGKEMYEGQFDVLERINIK